jgi:predicted ABC-type ATPase
MIYVVLDSVDLQLERIRNRVREGGHDVPADKVAARRHRSFNELAWFVDRVDECLIFNNSTGQPELVAQKGRAGLFCWDDLPADMDAVLSAAGVKRTTKLADLD